jgi:ribose 5-phosphate isomerase B
MKILIASDHAGFEFKELIKKYLSRYEVVDFGCLNKDSCDYPDFAHQLCQNLKGKEEDIGILICGTGIGMSIVANRYSHIRCALCHNIETVTMAREHNNANVLALGARIVPKNMINSIIHGFVYKSTSHEKKHMYRRDKINKINI